MTESLRLGDYKLIERIMCVDGSVTKRLTEELREYVDGYVTK